MVRSSALVCPPIVEYTLAFQIRASEEVEKLEAGSALLELVQDYGQLRDRVRACQ